MFKVSIVTVSLNAKKEIQGTIESVLSQTYPLIEYILIDGDSTDGTIDIVKTYKERISKLLVEKDHGVYDAMNKALSMATGDFLIFMNAGDKFVAEFTVENAMRSVRDRRLFIMAMLYLLIRRKGDRIFMVVHILLIRFVVLISAINLFFILRPLIKIILMT